MSTSKTLQPSSQAEMEQALAVLTAHKDAWATMDIPGRIALLDQINRIYQVLKNVGLPQA